MKKFITLLLLYTSLAFAQPPGVALTPENQLVYNANNVLEYVLYAGYNPQGDVVAYIPLSQAAKALNLTEKQVREAVARHPWLFLYVLWEGDDTSDEQFIGIRVDTTGEGGV